MKTTRTTRVIAASLLGLALAATAAPAMASADPDEGIEVSVTIDPIRTPGEVSMTVADNNGVTLTENGTNAAARQFTGTLPTVTVTDTRLPEEIPAGDFWAVVGQASQFTATGGGTATIGP
ncbi:hypothetical protein ABZ664_06505, partial [Streptosporangium sp. NPDC006930]